jgi:nucleoside-diphosphate-sugar epimerase
MNGKYVRMRLPAAPLARHDPVTSKPGAVMSKNLQDKRVLVLGANGRLGRAAVQAFAAAGWRVLAQARQAPGQPLPANAVALQADALDVEALVRQASGVAVIVNALNPDYARWGTLLPPLTDAVLRLAAATGATVMLPGNVYNFGSQLPPVLQETTPFAGDHAKARLRIALEQRLQAEAPRSIVIRAGDYLGGSGTWFDMAMTKPLARNGLTHMGPRDITHAWAWLPDLAQVFVRVAERREQLPAHAVLHYAGLTLTGAELHAAIETAVGRPLRAGRFPWWTLMLGAPFVPLLRSLLQMRYLWHRPHQLDESRLQALIGPVPHTPVVEVMRRCLADLTPQNLSSTRKVAVV